MNLKTAARPCPICDTAKVECLHHQRFELPEGHPLPRNFDVVACPTCGFIYADTIGTAMDYDRYYADYSKYADQGTGTGGGGNPKDQARLHTTAATIAQAIPDRGARIVDIGCANGGLLGALKGMGYARLLGIDPSPSCVSNTERLFGVTAEQGWLLALPPRAAPADVVIVSHVLEHVLDLREALDRIGAVLAAQGLVYAEVPDAQRYVDCLAAPFQDFNTEHINHFDAISLENLFRSCGFEAVIIGRKTLEAAEGVLYPAVYGLFRRVQDGTVRATFKRDSAAQDDIRRYIAASQKELTAIEQLLQPYLKKPVIIWGTGQLTLKLLAETELGKAPIVTFTDGNPLNHGKKLVGIPIIDPRELKNLPPHPIIIGTLLYHRVIEQRIRRDLHLPNPIVVLSRANRGLSS